VPLATGVELVKVTLFYTGIGVPPQVGGSVLLFLFSCYLSAKTTEFIQVILGLFCQVMLKYENGSYRQNTLQARKFE